MLDGFSSNSECAGQRSQLIICQLVVLNGLLIALSGGIRVLWTRQISSWYSAPSVLSFIGSKVIFWWKCALQATFLDGFLSNFSQMCITDMHHSCFSQCSVFYRVKGHILVHILVCALTAAFLDGFLSNFVWRCILVKSTQIFFWWCCPQCSIFYRVKCHILVEILCALCRPHFLVDFFQHFHRCAS